MVSIQSPSKVEQPAPTSQVAFAAWYRLLGFRKDVRKNLVDGPSLGSCAIGMHHD